MSKEKEKDQDLEDSTVNYSYVTRQKKKSYRFSWEIDHFSSIITSLEKITSPPFPLGDNANQLILEIRHEIRRKALYGSYIPFDIITFDLLAKTEIQEYMEYCLYLKSDNHTFKAHSCSGFMKDKYKFSMGIDVEKFETEMGWRANSNYSLNLVVEISILESLEDYKSESLLEHINSECEDSQQHQLSLLQIKQGTDFSFTVKDKTFHVHKILLALKSPVFQKMFYTNMSENRTSVATVTDVEPQAFGKMLQFIYCEKINEEELKTSACSLLYLATKYELKKLRCICINFLHKNLSQENVIDVLKCSILYEIYSLKIRCLKMIKSLNAINDLEDIRNLIKEYPSLLADIVSESEDEKCIWDASVPVKYSHMSKTSYCLKTDTFFKENFDRRVIENYEFF